MFSKIQILAEKWFSDADLAFDLLELHYIPYSLDLVMLPIELRA